MGIQGDPLRTVQPGEPMRISADTWNRILNDVRNRPATAPIPVDTDRVYNQAIVRAANDTDNDPGGPFDLPVFSIVTLIDGVPTNAGDAAYEGYFSARSPGNGVTGDPTTELIGVTLDPLPAGSTKLGRVCIVGVVPVKLASADIGGGYCDATAGAIDTMTAMPGGRFPILGDTSTIGGRSNVAFVCLGAGGAGPEFFEVTVNDRQEVSGTWSYGWVGIVDSSKTGTLPATAVFVHVQTSDGLNPDIYTLALKGATAGSTFTLADPSTPTSAIAYDASASTVQALLTNFTVSGDGTVATPYTFTGNDGSSHALIVDGSGLLPTVSHSPLVFSNNNPMDVPVNCWARLKSGANPKVKVDITQEANGASLPMIFVVTISHTVDGVMTGAFDEGSASGSIPWNPTASQVHTALTALVACTVTGTDLTGPFTVTVTADNDAHTLAFDTANLFGDKIYAGFWSNGNACTGPVGGVYPPSISGWTGPPTPSIAISPSGSSAGPWVVTITDAASGTYQITVDGGSPVSTSFSASASLSGFTASGLTTSPTTLSFTLTASSGSHTLLGFGALLGAAQPEQYLVINPGQCVALRAPVQCSTGGS